MSITKRWRDHIEAWQDSGLKQVDYCRQHAISSVSLVGIGRRRY